LSGVGHEIFYGSHYKPKRAVPRAWRPADQISKKKRRPLPLAAA